MKGRKAFDRRSGARLDKEKKRKNRKRETIGEVLLEIQVKGLNFKGEKKTSEGWN